MAGKLRTRKNGTGFIMVYVLLLAALVSIATLRAAAMVKTIDGALYSEAQSAAIKDAALDAAAAAVALIDLKAGRHTLDDPWAMIGEKKFEFRIPGQSAEDSNATLAVFVADEDRKLNLLRASPEELRALAIRYGAAYLAGELENLAAHAGSSESDNPKSMEDLSTHDSYRKIAVEAPGLLGCLTICGDGLINANTCPVEVLASLREIYASGRPDAWAAKLIAARPFRSEAEIVEAIEGTTLEEKKALLRRIKLKSCFFRVTCSARGADRIFEAFRIIRTGSSDGPDAGNAVTVASWEVWR